jgi:hypothetical protein
MRSVALGLLQWHVAHPDWTPDAQPGTQEYWPREVGCVAVRDQTTTAFIDPLAPAGRDEWEALDGLAADRERVVVTTASWHGRDGELFAQRYGARMLTGADPWPDVIEPLPVPRALETMVWIPAHRALVPGDVLVGDDAGGLTICPQAWLQTAPVAEVQATLRELIPRPVDKVLASHWAPVTTGADAALQAALTPDS